MLSNLKKNCAQQGIEPSYSGQELQLLDCQGHLITVIFILPRRKAHPHVFSAERSHWTPNVTVDKISND